jgi:hypothetical protein
MSGALSVLTSVNAAAAASTTTFDPSNKDGDITLSGGNLVATAGAGAGIGTNVRTVATYTLGASVKKYCEFTATTISGSAASFGFGLVNGTFAIGTAAYIGTDFNSAAVYGNDGALIRNDTVIGTGNTFVQGDIIGVAIDFSASLFWFRVNAGNWNNNGSANPATGVGGFDISAFGAVAMYAAVEAENDTEAWTANFGGSSYSQTAPSGFDNW